MCITSHCASVNFSLNIKRVPHSKNFGFEDFMNCHFKSTVRNQRWDSFYGNTLIEIGVVGKEISLKMSRTIARKETRVFYPFLLTETPILQKFISIFHRVHYSTICRPSAPLNLDPSFAHLTHDGGGDCNSIIRQPYKVAQLEM